MSTFDGIIREFPSVRIDFFRGLHQQPALACFLSHVHSDHLAGLDTLRSPFVYCSAATREILLRLERYPCRINYAQGIIEAREQTYRHLAKVLKALPLDTPTFLELGPNEPIQVTLVDANHCIGAVMFLIENEHNAILYTGDVRAEPWWVNSIARNPCLIEYTTGLKTLDRIYLDTSVLDDIPLQTKAEGLRELLSQVSQYPRDTIFCMQAWTYGYEEVWTALSKALNSKIHVDKYKMRIYKSLIGKAEGGRFSAQNHLSKEAPSLVGFTCGNHQREGCLTLDEAVRIHSCEKGTPCTTMQNKPIVWIKPIVAHLRGGHDLLEVGVGGGGEDLAKEAELQNLSAEDIDKLVKLASDELDIPKELQDDFKLVLQKSEGSLRELALNLDISTFTEDLHTSIVDAVHAMMLRVKDIHHPVATQSAPKEEQFLPKSTAGQPKSTPSLPNRIRFPYARHSSLPELRHLVETFRPNDVWPCTVDIRSWYDRGITMQGLFGDCCSDRNQVFAHDELMQNIFQTQREDGILARQDSGDQEGESVQGQRSQRTEVSVPIPSSPPLTLPLVNTTGFGRASSPILISSDPREVKEEGQDEPLQDLGYSPYQRRQGMLSAQEQEQIADSSKRNFDAFQQHNYRVQNMVYDGVNQEETQEDLELSSLEDRTPRRPRIEAFRSDNYDDDDDDDDDEDYHNRHHDHDDSQISDPQSNDNSHSSITIIMGGGDDVAATASSSSTVRLNAFKAAERCIFGDETWGSHPGIGLISTTDNHSTLEVELGTQP